MTELAPEEPVAWYRLAIAQLGASQAEDYRAICRRMVEQFRDTASPAESYWTVWTCLLGPQSVEDYSPLVQLAEQTVTAEPESVQYLKTLGGILCRAGRFEDAIRPLTKANARVEDPESKSLSSPAYTWYFLAMAQHKLGHDSEARQWLQKATEWTDEVLGEHENGTAAVPWNLRLTLKLLRDQAEQTIASNEKDPANDN